MLASNSACPSNCSVLRSPLHFHTQVAGFSRNNDTNRELSYLLINSLRWRELWSDEVIAQKHKEALFHFKTEGKHPTGFLSSLSTDCSDKSVEMLLRSIISFPCEDLVLSPFKEKKNVFSQNCVTPEPWQLVHVMMSWFHHGFTSSPSISAMMTSEWDDPAALASLPINQFSRRPHYSSSPLFIAPPYRHGS